MICYFFPVRGPQIEQRGVGAPSPTVQGVRRLGVDGRDDLGRKVGPIDRVFSKAAPLHVFGTVSSGFRKTCQKSFTSPISNEILNCSSWVDRRPRIFLDGDWFFFSWIVGWGIAPGASARVGDGPGFSQPSSGIGPGTSLRAPRARGCCVCVCIPRYQTSIPSLDDSKVWALEAAAADSVFSGC